MNRVIHVCHPRGHHWLTTPNKRLLTRRCSKLLLRCAMRSVKLCRKCIRLHPILKASCVIELPYTNNCLIPLLEERLYLVPSDDHSYLYENDFCYLEALIWNYFFFLQICCSDAYFCFIYREYCTIVCTTLLHSSVIHVEKVRMEERKKMENKLIYLI